jgi:hypothetical protein
MEEDPQSIMSVGRNGYWSARIEFLYFSDLIKNL